MSVPLRAERSAALDPVRDRLIGRARQDADAVTAAARADAEAVIAAARDQARAVLDEAREQGGAEAAAQTRAARSAARREARGMLLAAQRAVYDAVRESIELNVLALREAPDYAALVAVLERRVHDLLGPRAEITADARGGVVAAVPGKRVDLSLPAIAARAVERLDDEAVRLWTR
ncbi:hypothetical protein KGA66_22800 [Actinocrinis puniceicyclus]|uniref:Uncharacterized protein n=1 Tax=Actinocrinis puniceicyclus TaxID=977794 RepID=A0A8J7WNX1_9ACTN|nr:hypothetical protein [Actinocrinis puniceicyclus]MBS2965896.1 hypothetical protein [Actinocrinis puniceicyclus]